MKNWFHHLGLAAIATHELDAMTQHEWRLLYVLRALPEDLGRSWFVAVHVPLFAALFWLTYHAQARIREPSRCLLAAFLVIHVGLHLRLSGHALYTFHGALSKAIIFGAGFCGLMYLVMDFAQRRKWI